MRFLPALILGASLVLPAFADRPGETAEAEEQSYVPGQQAGIYRFGATYDYLFTDTASECQAACNADAECFAWSHVEALYSGNSRCELKHGAGRAERNGLATSGISKRHEDKFSPPPPSEELKGGEGILSPASRKPPRGEAPIAPALAGSDL